MKRKHYLQYPFDPKLMAESNWGKKITQPNMAHTVKEMIERTNQGLTVNIDPNLIYPDHEDDSLLSDINDLSDIDNVVQNVKEFNDKIAEAKATPTEKTKTNDEDKSNAERLTTKEDTLKED